MSKKNKKLKQILTEVINGTWNIQQTDLTKYSVNMSKQILNEIIALNMNNTNLEWIGALNGSFDSKTLTYNIESLSIYDQINSSAHTEFTIEGNRKKNENIHIGIIHSHNEMNVFFSSEDTQIALQNELSIVVNNKLECIARINVKTIHGYNTVLDIPVFFETPSDIFDKNKHLIKQSNNFSITKTKNELKDSIWNNTTKKETVNKDDTEYCESCFSWKPTKQTQKKFNGTIICDDCQLCKENTNSFPSWDY